MSRLRRSVIRRGFVGGTPGSRPSAFDPSVELAPSEIVEGGERADVLFKRALDARRNPTNAERKLWGALHVRGLDAYFKRQRVFGNYYVDLYCPSRDTVIEIDGALGHSTDADRAYDARRTQYFASRNIPVFRTTNSAVYADALAVADAIGAALRLGKAKRAPHPDTHTATAWMDER